MYGYSRALYRQLADDLDPEDRAIVLEACERTVERLAAGGLPQLARRRLYADVRPFVPLARLPYARRVIERGCDECSRYLRAQADAGRDPFGDARPCASTTRRGEPCRRGFVDRTGYCPSHRHLALRELAYAAA